jgi:hypothetical protein
MTNWKDYVCNTVVALCMASSVAMIGVMIKAHIWDEKTDKAKTKQR